MTRTVLRKQVVQYGVLPWRRTADSFEVLLITTRTTHRWIVPKGWPEQGRTPCECAVQEAFEEAGVVGNVSDEVIGVFSHRKQLKSGDTIVCRVHIYAMEVTNFCDEWPEKYERKAKWSSVDEALSLITELGLRRIIAKFFRATHAVHKTA